MKNSGDQKFNNKTNFGIKDSKLENATVNHSRFENRSFIAKALPSAIRASQKSLK